MSKILSQAEIDALLQTAAGRTEGAEPTGGSNATRRYNFRRPERVSKEQLESVRLLHERFARSVTTALSAYLRTTVDLSLVSIDQCVYADFLAGLSDPTAFYALNLAPSEAPGALELHPAVAFAAVDRMLGGAGRTMPLDRAFTDIELNVVDSVVRVLLEGLTQTWKAIVETTFAVRARETRPLMLQIAAPNDVVVLFLFDATIAETRGPIHLAVPASLLEVASSLSMPAWLKPQRGATPQERVWMTENLGSVPVTLSPLIETRLRGREVLALDRGDVISLGVRVNTPVDLRVGGVCKLRGRLVARDQRAMVQIDRRCVSPIAGEA
jgi:flagellar motor switch protein FliM